MSRGAPDNAVKAPHGFEIKDPRQVNNISEPARGGIDANELQTLRSRVMQLEAQKFAQEKQIRKLTTSLAVTLSKNIASCRYR